MIIDSNGVTKNTSLGDYTVASQASATNFPASNAFGDGASISLTAGDWEVSAVLNAANNGATCTSVDIGVSTTSGNSTTGLVIGDSRFETSGPTANNDTSLAIAGLRVSPTSTTTYYCKVKAIYSAGNPQYTCRISARKFA